MNIKQRVGRLEESVNHQKGIRLIVAHRQADETEQQAIERCERDLQAPRKGLVILSESDLDL